MDIIKEKTAYCVRVDPPIPAALDLTRPFTHLTASLPYHQGSAAISGRIVPKSRHDLVIPEFKLLAGKQGRARDCGNIGGTRNSRKFAMFNARNAGGSAHCNSLHPPL